VPRADTMDVLIVEDEEIVARRLQRLVTTILGGRLHSVRVLDTLSDGLAHVGEHPIDLLFLDLDLGGRDGFRMLTEAVAGSFHTIVVSARTDEAIRAFELGVTDFVPKPYTQERLRQAIDRVTRRDSTLRNRLRFLAVRRPGEIRVIPIDSVLEIRGAGDYSELVCADGSTHLHDKTLKTLELVLPARFVRVHRSHIVDLGALERIESEPGSRYFAVLRNGSRVPVSRSRVDALRSRLG